LQKNLLVNCGPLAFLGRTRIAQDGMVATVLPALPSWRQGMSLVQQGHSYREIGPSKNTASK
jgi:hypothetical protein